MAGKRKTRPKGFDPEVWSLLSDDVKGRKDLNKTQKSVYALLLMMSFRYTKTDGWFWHKLDDVVSELGDHGLAMTKRNLQDNVLPTLIRTGLIAYRPGSNIGGRNIASYFKVFENQGVGLKNFTQYLSSGLTTPQNSGYCIDNQAVERKNFTPYHCDVPITPENDHYRSHNQTVEEKNFTPSQGYPVYTPENTTYQIENQAVKSENFTPSDRNIIEVTENQSFMEKTSPLNKIKLKEKNDNDPKELLLLEDNTQEKKERNVKERKLVPDGAVVLKNSIQSSHQLSLDSLFDCHDLGNLNTMVWDIYRQGRVSKWEALKAYKEAISGLDLVSNGPVNTFTSFFFFKEVVELIARVEDYLNTNDFTDEVEKGLYRRYARLYDKYLTGTEFNYSDEGVAGIRIVYDKSSLNRDFQDAKKLLGQHMSKDRLRYYLRWHMMERIRAWRPRHN